MKDVFDAQRCELGEGALWHPLRGELIWFDIVNDRMLRRGDGDTTVHHFDDHVSAAGWIDREHVLVAARSGLWHVDLDTDDRNLVAPLELAPHLRTNDGRADPWGGFWIGTMGKRAERDAGSIRRYHRGEMRELRPAVTIPNAICFDPEREIAYFADTRMRKVWRQRLRSADGWPVGEPELYLDLRGEGLNPDGAVLDSAGNFWNAQWGAGRVACYDPLGNLIGAELFPAGQLSCPAFGGADFDALFVTSAMQDMNASEREAEPCSGMTFRRRLAIKGVAEPRVVLG